MAAVVVVVVVKLIPDEGSQEQDEAGYDEGEDCGYCEVGVALSPGQV